MDFIYESYDLELICIKNHIISRWNTLCMETRVLRNGLYCSSVYWTSHLLPLLLTYVNNIIIDKTKVYSCINRGIKRESKYG